MTKRTSTRTGPPLVVPEDARSFARLGQLVEIPEDVVFTVEYSVRRAMHAVHELLGLGLSIPGSYHGSAHPKISAAALRTAFA